MWEFLLRSPRVMLSVQYVHQCRSVGMGQLIYVMDEPKRKLSPKIMYFDLCDQ
jgi:hypothetical protein